MNRLTAENTTDKYVLAPRPPHAAAHNTDYPHMFTSLHVKPAFICIRRKFNVKQAILFNAYIRLTSEVKIRWYFYAITCKNTIPVCVSVYYHRHCPVLLAHILLRGTLQREVITGYYYGIPA